MFDGRSVPIKQLAVVVLGSLLATGAALLSLVRAQAAGVAPATTAPATSPADRSIRTNSAGETVLTFDDAEVGKAIPSRTSGTVTFTLAETRTLSDDSYTLEGHLEPGAKIYTRSFKPELRANKMRGD